MLLFVALVSVLLTLALAQDAPIPAAPTNSSSYQPSNNGTGQLVLGLPITPAGPNDPPIFALTPAAFSAVPHDPGTLQGIGDHIYDTNPSTSKNISEPSHAIAYISCDPGAYNGNIGLAQVLNDAINANCSAVLFYSTTQNFCQLSPNLPPLQSQYARYYTMVNMADSQRVLSSLLGMLADHSGAAEVMTSAAYNNVMNTSENQQGINSTPSTAVAMIILYSITGVITALFLVIIVTGAVRAHRHPERYGPQNVLGRPRQSRAKGLARAMLDTIPIVKFGERQPSKTGDVELARTPGVAASSEQEKHAASSSRDQQPESEAHEVEGNDIERAAGTAGAAGEASDSHQSGSKPTDGPTEDENLSCSICTEDFEKGQDIRVLPCGHRFHPPCVDPWLLDVSGTCPLCRVDLRPQEERKSGEEGNRVGEGQRSRSRDGEPLPPPLSEGRDRRRDTIRNFLDLRRMQGSNSEERISALRRWRQHNRRSRASDVVQDEGSAVAESSGTRDDAHEHR